MLNRVQKALAAVATGAALLAAAPAAEATSGALNTTFGISGLLTELIGSSTAGIQSAIQPNGDIVTAGAAIVNGTSEMLVQRELPNGTLDPSFGAGGVAVFPIGKNAYADAITLQTNGDIVVAGTGRSPVTGTLSLATVRLTPNGRLDATFGNNGIAVLPVGSNAVADSVALLPNGQLIIGGTATTSTNHFVAARLNANGTLDTSYGTDGVTLLPPTAAAWGMALEPSGGVVLVGQETYNGTQVYMAAQLTPAGVADPSFGQQGTVTIPLGTKAAAMAVALQPNGDVVITGNSDIGVPTVRLNPDGTFDHSFGVGGIATLAGSGVNALTLQSNGDIVLAGAGPSAVRLTPSGAMDTTFGHRGISFATVGVNGSANGVAITSGGAIVLTGATSLLGALHLVLAELYS